MWIGLVIGVLVFSMYCFGVVCFIFKIFVLCVDSCYLNSLLKNNKIKFNILKIFNKNWLYVVKFKSYMLLSFFFIKFNFLLCVEDIKFNCSIVVVKFLICK